MCLATGAPAPPAPVPVPDDMPRPAPRLMSNLARRAGGVIERVRNQGRKQEDIIREKQAVRMDANQDR